MLRIRGVNAAKCQLGYRVLAPAYDAVFGASLNPGRRKAIRLLDARPGERILEVCVGTGLSLSLYPSEARVTGVDLSQEMLRRAAARVARQRLCQVDALLQMDAQRLEFQDGSFDKVAFMYALSGLPDPALALSEARRVCRPEGAIVVVDHFRSDRRLIRLCERLLSRAYRRLHYRTDLDLAALVQAARLAPERMHPANLFGYNTVLLFR